MATFADMLRGTTATRTPTRRLEPTMAAQSASPYAGSFGKNQTYDLNHDPGDVSGNRTKQSIMDLGSAQAGLTGNANSDRNQFLSMLNGGGDYLKSLVSQAMPEFNSRLNGVRENAIARGISTGDLGTSYEGDLASAFQKNIANQAAGLYTTQLGAAQNLYGQDISREQANQGSYLDLLTGRLSFEESKKQAAKDRKASLTSGLLGAAGSAAGFFAGG